jgi:hypothetical protein
MKESDDIFKRLQQSYLYQKENQDNHTKVNEWDDALGKTGELKGNFNEVRTYEELLPIFGNHKISNGLNCHGLHNMGKHPHYPLFTKDLKDFCIKKTGMLEESFVIENHFQLFGEKITETKIIPPLFYKLGLDVKFVKDLIDSPTKKTVLEIGAGWGGFPHLMLDKVKNLNYIVVDIPSTINISAYFSYKLGRTIRLPGEGKIDNINFDEFDIVFITPEEILQIKNRSVDMVINMDSLTEMTNETIKYYTEHMFRVSKKYVFSSNRRFHQERYGNLQHAFKNRSEDFEKIEDRDMVVMEMNKTAEDGSPLGSDYDFFAVALGMSTNYGELLYKLK